MTGVKSIYLLSLGFHSYTCSVVPEESKETKRKHFDDTFNFIFDLKDKSENTQEFIAKMQAVFCPKQPICNTEDSLVDERSEVINNLNTELTIGNDTVKLDDLAAVLWLCCMPCDCSDSCEMKGNCCPSKHNVNGSMAASELRFDCVQASSMGYVSLSDSKVPNYFMITRCFEDRTSLTVLEKCERPTIYSTEEVFPVTSMKSGHTYWNWHCARCNMDSNALLKWETYVVFKLTVIIL